MTPINLLPPEIQHRQRRRRRIQTFAMVQAVIFVLLAGAFAFIRAQEIRARDHSADLARQIANIDRTPIEAYQAARESAAVYELALAFIDETFPPAFAPAYLTAILEAVPPAVYLLTLRFDGEFYTLTASAPHLGDIIPHQQLLYGTTLFESTYLSTTIRTDDGRTRYDLRLIPAARP